VVPKVRLWLPSVLLRRIPQPLDPIVFHLLDDLVRDDALHFVPRPAYRDVAHVSVGRDGCYSLWHSCLAVRRSDPLGWEFASHLRVGVALRIRARCSPANLETTTSSRGWDRTLLRCTVYIQIHLDARRHRARRAPRRIWDALSIALSHDAGMVTIERHVNRVSAMKLGA
jgi:hypothetical protein